MTFDSLCQKITLSRNGNHPVIFLLGESHEQTEFGGGYSPWGCRALDMTERSTGHEKTITRRCRCVCSVIHELC